MNNAIRYEDATVTEYSDGTERVYFTPEQYAIMATDPIFGYVRPCGHPTNIQNGTLIDSDCMICEAGYSDYDDDDAAMAPAGRS